MKSSVGSKYWFCPSCGFANWLFDGVCARCWERKPNGQPTKKGEE